MKTCEESVKRNAELFLSILRLLSQKQRLNQFVDSFCLQNFSAEIDQCSIKSPNFAVHWKLFKLSKEVPKLATLLWRYCHIMQRKLELISITKFQHLGVTSWSAVYFRKTLYFLVSQRNIEVEKIELSWVELIEVLKISKALKAKCSAERN